MFIVSVEEYARTRGENAHRPPTEFHVPFVLAFPPGFTKPGQLAAPISVNEYKYTGKTGKTGNTGNTGRAPQQGSYRPCLHGVSNLSSLSAPNFLNGVYSKTFSVISLSPTVSRCTTAAGKMQPWALIA